MKNLIHEIATLHDDDLRPVSEDIMQILEITDLSPITRKIIHALACDFSREILRRACPKATEEQLDFIMKGSEADPNRNVQ